MNIGINLKLCIKPFQSGTSVLVNLLFLIIGVSFDASLIVYADNYAVVAAHADCFPKKCWLMSKSYFIVVPPLNTITTVTQHSLLSEIVFYIFTVISNISMWHPGSLGATSRK